MDSSSFSTRLRICSRASQPSRQRLWHRFGVASPAGDGPVHFDAAADIAQVTLGGVALILGRNLRPDEYPEALPSLLMEVIEVAQIRGSAPSRPDCSGSSSDRCRFPDAVPTPLPTRRSTTCDSSCGATSASMSAGRPSSTSPRRWTGNFRRCHRQRSSRDALSAHRDPAAHSPRVPELDEFLDSFESPSQADADVASPATDTLDDEAIETELSFDSLETEPERDTERGEREREDEIYDLPPLDQVMADENILAAAPSAVPRVPRHGSIADRRA